jgi:hypothetical protein
MKRTGAILLAALVAVFVARAQAEDKTRTTSGSRS